MPKWLKYQRRISKETNAGFLLFFVISIYLSFYDLTALWSTFAIIIWYFVMVYLLYCKFVKTEDGKTLNDYTIKEFMKVPSAKWNEVIKDFDSLIIIPTNQVHDSEYMCMEFIACKGEEPIARISGCSDVIHINGIGGYGINGNRSRNEMKAPIGWSIDCLATSKLLRLFSDPGKKLQSGLALSSFEIFSIPQQ